MDFKGQGAVEYLLILGAAVILAVVVIVTLTSLSDTTHTQVDAAQNVDMPNICSSDKCYASSIGRCVVKTVNGSTGGTPGNPPFMDSEGYCFCQSTLTVDQDGLCN